MAVVERVVPAEDPFGDLNDRDMGPDASPNDRAETQVGARAGGSAPVVWVRHGQSVGWVSPDRGGHAFPRRGQSGPGAVGPFEPVVTDMHVHPIRLGAVPRRCHQGSLLAEQGGGVLFHADGR